MEQYVAASGDCVALIYSALQIQDNSGVGVGRTAWHRRFGHGSVVAGDVAGNCDGPSCREVRWEKRFGIYCYIS